MFLVRMRLGVILVGDLEVRHEAAFPLCLLHAPALPCHLIGEGIVELATFHTARSNLSFSDSWAKHVCLAPWRRAQVSVGYPYQKVRSDQIRSVTQSCPTLCDPMNHSTPGLPVHHQLLEFTETHVHRVSDAIQPSHPLSSPSPPAPNPSQHQSLFQWVNSSREVSKVLEFQL